ATDFLLLALGHRCKEFEGMCCMNPSDHSQSIHHSIQELQEGIKQLRIDDGFTWFDGLLN
ncbi:hypothetical protein N322_04642, partial [Cariama cristata]